MEQQGLRHPERLADTLAAAGRRRFVGRTAELAAFEAVLDRSEPISAIWLSALGGVGKTALMQAWADLARQAGWPVARMDGRTVRLAPQTFAAAVELAAGANGSRSDGDPLA